MLSVFSQIFFALSSASAIAIRFCVCVCVRVCVFLSFLLQIQRKFEFNKECMH